MPGNELVVEGAPLFEVADVSGDGKKWINRPLRWSLVYLLGTFFIFFFTFSAGEVTSIWPMALVPPAGAAFFALGYRLRAAKPSFHLNAVARRPPVALIAFAALWAIAYGIVNLQSFHASGVSDFLNVALDPGQAYKAKFEVFEQRESLAVVSRPMQLLTLSSGFMTLLAPLTVVWWSRLTKAVRVIAVFGMLAWAAPFAYIGTNVGFAYLAIWLLCGTAIARAAGLIRNPKRLKWSVGLTLAAVLAYMLIGNIGRTEAFGVKRNYNANVASVVGEDWARALENVLFYPTHGYLGLSETMTQPFVFTGGYGGSSVLARYAVQYFNLPDTYLQNYPMRTEVMTGYPADLVWHTVYPWLASDLTFYGAVAFMAVVGWATASWWIRSVRDFDPLSIGLFAYSAMFIVFIPANNQIGMNQMNLIGLTTLLLCYFARWVLKPRVRRRLAGVNGSPVGGSGLSPTGPRPRATHFDQDRWSAAADSHGGDAL